MIFCIKPHGFLVNHLAKQLVWDIEFFPALAQLKTDASYHCYIFLARLRFEVEEIFEKMKMGFNPQKSLAQMNKNRDVEDGVWGQVMHLNPIVKKKTTEEIRSQNCKSALNKRRKKNYLIRLFKWTRVA